MLQVYVGLISLGKWIRFVSLVHHASSQFEGRGQLISIEKTDDYFG